jgi:tRNA-dihydrouridine synthase
LGAKRNVSISKQTDSRRSSICSHFIDSNHRAEDGRFTVNQPMKQTKNQPLTTEPLKLCTTQKPSTKTAVIEKCDLSVSTIVAIIKKTTFFKQYSALTRLKRTAGYCLHLFHNAKSFLQFIPSAPNFGEMWEGVVKSMKLLLKKATLTFICCL